MNFVEDDADGSLNGELLFNAAILDHATVERLLVLLTALLRDAVEAPNVAMHDLLTQMDLPLMADSHIVLARRVRLTRDQNKVVSPFEIEEEAFRRSHVAARNVVAMGAPLRGAVASPTMPELLESVLDAVRTHTRDEQVAPDTPLMDAGLNSLNATQLSTELERRTGLALPPILIFQYSTAGAIAGHLHSELQSPVLEQSPCTSIQAGASHYRHADVRVSGTAARWPNGAASDRELAQLADATCDAVSEVPANRWLVSEDASRYPAVRYVAHVPNAELFDSASFAISPAEAVWMDPQQRLLLEKGYASLHASRPDADHGRSSLLARNVAVMVGIQANDFATISMSTPMKTLPVYAVSGSTFSVAAGRLSYVLGFQVCQLRAYVIHVAPNTHAHPTCILMHAHAIHT